MSSTEHLRGSFGRSFAWNHETDSDMPTGDDAFQPHQLRLDSPNKCRDVLLARLPTHNKNDCLERTSLVNYNKKAQAAYPAAQAREYTTYEVADFPFTNYLRLTTDLV